MKTEEYRLAWVDAAAYLDLHGFGEAANSLRARLMIAMAVRPARVEKHWLVDVDVSQLVPEPSNRRTKAVTAMRSFASREAFLGASREEMLRIPNVGEATADLLLIIQERMKETSND